ncbi:hypothetical protein OHA98_15275 [Streptomyces sp. NBC_00654]|nr:hypothetical protein [Streptomyces sp. NBC_00654]
MVQYYLLAGNVCRLHRLRWAMETSLLKTLAAKHRSTVSKMAARYKAKVETPYGSRTCFEASIPSGAGRKPLVARFGGISLTRQKAAVRGPSSGQPPPQKRADYPALEREVRAMRDIGRRASAPHPKNRRPRQGRSTY